MRPLALDEELDEAIEEVRKAILWDLRDDHEVARRRWEELVAGDGMGPAIDSRILLTWAQICGAEDSGSAKKAAEVFELLRVAGDLLDSAEGFDGPAKGVLGERDARFLAEWLVPYVWELTLQREDLELSQEAAEFARLLAVGRNLERGYRTRKDPTSFDGVSLGILHGVLESKYSRPLRVAASAGARLGGASEGQASLAGSVAEAAGMAMGYMVNLREGWDRAVVEKKALRKILVRDGLQAVGEMRVAIGWARVRGGEEWDLAPLEHWVEDLEKAFQEEPSDDGSAP